MRNDDHDGKGTYIIILYMNMGKSIQIGALGKYKFKRGYYAYVGSAFGPGGLKSRVKHHIEPKKSYHWHIDFLNPVVKEVWVSDHGARFEHAWATALGETASNKILGFGCSDCSCESHLLYFKSMAILKNLIHGNLKISEYLCKNSHVRIVRSQFLSDLKFDSISLPRIFRLTTQNL